MTLIRLSDLHDTHNQPSEKLNSFIELKPETLRFYYHDPAYTRIGDDLEEQELFYYREVIFLKKHINQLELCHDSRFLSYFIKINTEPIYGGETRAEAKPIFDKIKKWWAEDGSA